MDEELKNQLKSALMDFVGEGMNCVCNAEHKDECVCGADWATREEKFLERKLERTISALIEATNDIHEIGTAISDQERKRLDIDGIIDKYDSIADELENIENSVDGIL